VKLLLTYGLLAVTSLKSATSPQFHPFITAVHSHGSFNNKRPLLVSPSNYFMRYFYGLILGLVLLLSCKREHLPVVNKPDVPVKHILLKDITVPNLPSPYYHFEYNTDSLVINASFASGFTNYDVLYTGNKLREMRNNIIINHDTIRYVYDNAGRLAMLQFINANNVMYRHVFFGYNGNQIREIEWDHKEGDVGSLIDRTMNFTFYPDGNVKTITEHRPAISGAPEYTSVKTFEQYDESVNVDDFSLIHNGTYNDHLFLLQGFRLQKNNPRKEKLSVNGVDFYTIDFTYTYNADKTPSAKMGDFLYLSGANAGQHFQTQTFYSYY
jgi:hypothetical protein